jgi:hypothetical protein
MLHLPEKIYVNTQKKSIAPVELLYVKAYNNAHEEGIASDPEKVPATPQRNPPELRN